MTENDTKKGERGVENGEELTTPPKFTLKIKKGSKELGRTELMEEKILTSTEVKEIKKVIENLLVSEITKLETGGKSTNNSNEMLKAAITSLLEDCENCLSDNSKNYKEQRKTLFENIDRILTRIHIRKVLFNVEELRTKTNLEKILNWATKENKNYDKDFTQVLNAEMYWQEKNLPILYKDLVKSELAKLQEAEGITKTKKSKTKEPMDREGFSSLMVLMVIVFLIFGVIFFLSKTHKKDVHKSRK